MRVVDEEINLNVTQLEPTKPIQSAKTICTL